MFPVQIAKQITLTRNDDDTYKVEYNIPVKVGDITDIGKVEIKRANIELNIEALQDNSKNIMTFTIVNEHTCKDCSNLCPFIGDGKGNCIIDLKEVDIEKSWCTNFSLEKEKSL